MSSSSSSSTSTGIKFRQPVITKLDVNQHKRSGIIMFYADWCGACHAAAPRYMDLASRHPSIPFYAAPGEGIENIKGYPTFCQVTASGQILIDQPICVGYDANALIGYLKRISS